MWDKKRFSLYIPLTIIGRTSLGLIFTLPYECFVFRANFYQAYARYTSFNKHTYTYICIYQPVISCGVIHLTSTIDNREAIHTFLRKDTNRNHSFGTIPPSSE